MDSSRARIKLGFLLGAVATLFLLVAAAVLVKPRLSAALPALFLGAPLHRPGDQLPALLTEVEELDAHAGRLIGAGLAVPAPRIGPGNSRGPGGTS